jgi:hypothetical protein
MHFRRRLKNDLTISLKLIESLIHENLIQVIDVDVACGAYGLLLLHFHLERRACAPVGQSLQPHSIRVKLQREPHVTGVRQAKGPRPDLEERK